MDMDLRRSENFDKDEFYDQEAKEETNRLDHLKLLLFDLNSAIAPKESRITAIFAILDEFDHTKKQLHNQELEVRADHILLQKLSYALCMDPDSDEVGFLCHALEMVYRGSKKRVATSFHEVSEALLPILVDMIRAPMNFRHNVGGAGSEKGSTKGDPMEDVDFLNEDHPPSPQSAKGVWEDASSDGPFQPYGGHQDECYDYEEGAEETKETILTDEDDAEEELASALAAASLFSSAQESVNELMRAQRIGQEEEERKRSAQVGTMIISQQQPEAQWLSTRVNAVQSAEQQQEPITGPISDALVLQPVEQQQFDQHPMISSEGYYQWNPMPQGSTTSVDGLQDENGVWRPNIPLSNNGEGCHSGPNPNLAQIEDSTPPAEQEEVVKDDASASKKTNIKNSSTDAAHCDESMISDPSSASKQSSSLGGLAFYGLTDKSVAEESMISDPSYNSKQSSSLGGLAFYGLTKSVAEETDEDRSSNKSVEDEADNVMHIRGGGMGSEETKEPHSYQNEESYFSTGNGHEEPSYYYQGPAPVVGGLEKDESFRTTESSDYMDITARHSINSTISDLGASYTTRSEKLTASMWRSGLMQDIEENQCDDLTEATDKKDNSTRDGSFVAGGWQDSSHASHGASTHEESKETSQHGSSHNDDIYEFDEPDLSRTKEATKRYHSFHGGDQPHKGKTTSLAVRKVLKILRYFSRILSAMEPMAQHHGLVDALLYQITKDPLSIDDEDEIAARVDALAVIVNLACAEENKIMLCYHPGLLDSMISISNHDLAEEAREYSAIVLMNLAYAEEVKVHMVSHSYLLDTLLHLLYDVSPFTRRYASAALFTLACVYANTSLIASHCNGGILEALRRVLLNDPVDEARINAAEALFNLARNNAHGTVECMGNHPKLLASLAHSVVTDYSPDVRAYSARALEWLAADIHYPMPCHWSLLKALTIASGWTKISCISEALKMQSSINDNRKPMVEHPGLLDAMATLALLDGIDDGDVRMCAIYAIERLTKEPSTRHIMAKSQGVMTALTRATFYAEYEDPASERPTSLLMKNALKNLAAHL